MDQDLAMEEGIDEIVKENVLGLYRKVTSEEAEEFATSLGD